MEPSVLDLTSFTSHFVLKIFLRMFGVKNFPETFRLVMSITPPTLRWKLSLVYLFEVKIFFQNSKYHFEHVDPSSVTYGKRKWPYD